MRKGRRERRDNKTGERETHLAPLVAGLGHHGHLGDGRMEVQGVLNLPANGREGGTRRRE